MTSKQAIPTQQSASQIFSRKESPYYLNDAEKDIINQQLIELLHVKLLNTTRNANAHRLSAQRWKQINAYINLPTTALAAFSGASVLSDFDKSHIVVGFLTLIVAMLTSISTFLNPNQRANEHLQFASEYSALRDEIYWFLSLNCIEGAQNGERQYRLSDQITDELTREIHWLFKKVLNKIGELNTKAPIPFQWATNKARIAAFNEDKGVNKSAGSCQAKEDAHAAGAR